MNCVRTQVLSLPISTSLWEHYYRTVPHSLRSIYHAQCSYDSKQLSYYVMQW